MKTVVLMISLIATVPAQARAEALPDRSVPDLDTTITAYNARFPGPPTLVVSPVPPDGDYAPEAGAVPRWIAELGLTGHELRALTAVVGAYAAGRRPAGAEPPKPSAVAGVAGAVGAFALEVLADNARDRQRGSRYSNTISGDRELARPTRGPVPIPPLPPGKDLVPGRLIAFDSCGGALFSALTRLNQSYPAAPFTAFVRAVGTTAFSLPMRADPDCGAAAG